MSLPSTTSTPSAIVSDPLSQMNTYRSYVTILADHSAKDEIKLKAAQELSENFEVCVALIYFSTLVLFM
jgi:transformation/transcription domain-associated protein